MPKTAKKKKQSLKSLGFTVLGSIIVIIGFIGVFAFTNNISISVDTLFSDDKYPAEAFVRKRTDKPKASFLSSKIAAASKSSVAISTNDGASASVEYDKKDNKVKLKVLDRNNKRWNFRLARARS